MDCGVHELKRLRDADEELLLLDVRTDEELEIARIDGATHVPLHELEGRIGELDAWRDKRVVCMCHHGGRSAMAQQLLQEHGFGEVYNLAGGIDDWALEIDDDMPRY